MFSFAMDFKQKREVRPNLYITTFIIRLNNKFHPFSLITTF